MRALFAAAAVGLLASAGGLAIDNMTPSAMPEPASWALMLTGFAGMGAMLRANRQRRLVRVAA